MDQPAETSGRLDTTNLGRVKYRMQLLATPSVPMPRSEGRPYVTVRFDLAMNKLLEFDAAAGVAHWSVFYRLFWNDERLLYNGTGEFGHGWNSSEDFVVMHSALVWTPDVIAFYSSGYELRSHGCGIYDEAFLRANGYNVMWSQPGNIKVQCDAQLADFPFDSQRCTLVVGPWVDRSYVFRALHEGVVANPFAGDLRSEEWAVVSVHVESTSVEYINGAFDEVHYTLRFKRFPHFYIVNAILPMALVVTLSLLSMWLPIEEGSGERLGFAVTLFLTIMATVIFAAGYRPATREETWLDRYQAACFVLTVLPVLESVLVVWLQHLYEKVSRDEVVPRGGTPRGGSPKGARSKSVRPATPEEGATSDLKRSQSRTVTALAGLSSVVRSKSVVADARTALGANFRMRMIVFLMLKLPSLEWLITGHRGRGHLHPRHIDKFCRIVISLAAAAFCAKVISEIDISDVPSTQILAPPVFAGALFMVLSALLAIGFTVFRIIVLCSEQATARAATTEQQPVSRRQP